MEKLSLQLPGYTIGSVLGRINGRVIYRAIRSSDDSPVAIETLDCEYPDRSQIAAMRHEAGVSQRLIEVKGVRDIYTTISHSSGNLALVTELYESSLQFHLNQAAGAGLPVTEVLEIMLSLVKTLGEMHSRDIVHKALSADNVLFNPASGTVAISGLTIASELDSERQAVQVSNSLEGPLPYISPEQTGRMNRDLDYRSDYYSLGVLLFQLLTGKLPFYAENMLEWVHCHISRVPTPAHELNENIPEALSAITLKLLSKNPDLRYQSAAGLKHDLEYCADQIEIRQSLEPFQLGKKDVAHKFMVPQKLYGREREVSDLLGLFKSAVAGSAEVCLVYGNSGVGKSALINEINRPLVREHGFFVQSKFDQFQHTEAYTTIAASFRGLVQQILGEAEETLSEWKKDLSEALHPNASLVIDLVPELELIIGPQPSAADLPPAEQRNRLHIVLTSFLRVFAGKKHPVVLFLDDLQWCDSPTLELLRRIMTSRDLHYLLLIGAYRSNDIGAGHPLRLLLDDLQSQKNIRKLPVGLLKRDSVADLVADALKRTPEETRILSDMLFDKAQGNPFFTRELLRQLNKDGGLVFDPLNSNWNWDLDAIHWQDVSNDVVEFMVANLRKMPPETQKALQLAACIGSSFDLQTLATINETSVADAASALLPALKHYTVLPVNSDYRFVGDHQELDRKDLQSINPVYRFQHDRVQQAAYALIANHRLPAVHLSIGRLMLQKEGNAVPDDRLIDIVGHLNSGSLLLDSPVEKLRLAELNLKAGSRAKYSSAYETALNFLQTSASLLPEDPWEQTPQLMQLLAAEMQHCLYLTGCIEEAENWIGIMFEHAESDLEKADILAIRTRQYATLGRMEESIQSAIQGMILLGIDFTDKPTLDDIAKERRLVKVNLGDRSIEDLVNSDQVQDPATLTAMRLLMEIFAAAFLSASGNLFPYLVLKSANLSLKYGNSPETAFAYAAYGMLLCGEFDEPDIGYRYAKAGLAINKQLDDVTLRARVIYVYAMFVHHWNEHWSSLTPWFRKGIEAGYHSGDLLYLAYSAQDCVIWDPRMDLETAHKLHAENLQVVRECAYQDSLDSGTLFLQLQRNLLGLTNSPFSLSDDSFDEQQCLEGMRKRRFITGIANYHIYSAEICLLYGDYYRALQHVREQDKLIKSAMSLPQLVRFYVVAFITLAIDYLSQDNDQQKLTRARLQRDLERMTLWADNCEENFRHLQYLMTAELLKIDGYHGEAMELYDQSIDAARASGFLHDEATASERAARHLISLGRKRSAEGYLRGAHRLYDRWGAQRKLALLEQEFPVLNELVSEVNITLKHGSSAELDLSSVMKASREISGEIVLEKLLNKTIQILLENTGGQWGCLVARREGALTVEVSRLPDQEITVEGLPNHSLIPSVNGACVPLPITLISEVLHSGEAIVLHDATSEGLFVQDPYVIKHKPKSVFCVPIQRERFEGVIYMENNLASGVFTESRAEVIRLLAAQAAVAIENACLYEQVQDYSRTLEEKVTERTMRLEQLNNELQSLVDCDGLTGVANRRRGDQYLAEVWVRLRRENQPLSLIMLDVDHFKAYNDNYGHQEGDVCLVKVATTAETQLQRPSDLLARYGGEEFMLILPNTDHEGVIQVGEKVRRAIEELAITHDHSTAASVVTVSMGAATVIPNKNGATESLLREADTALYRAKKLGRNQLQTA